MILINYVNISDVPNYKNFISEVPELMQKKINSFINEDDKKRCLAGKLILKKMLLELGYSSTILNDIKTDKNNRPYINENIDFNISHSGNYVVCAISSASKIGIDIEEIKVIDINEIKDYVLSEKEQKKMTSMENPLEMFYESWTLKEAALKASGYGLTISMKEIEVYDNNLKCCNEIWNFRKLSIHKNYSTHIVYKRELDILIKEADIFSAN